MDDPLNTLFTRFRPSAKMAFSGTVCGMLNDQHEVELGHLHLMRAGRMTVQPRGSDAVRLDEPGLVFLPRAIPHTLTADEGNDATLLCATIEIGQQVGSSSEAVSIAIQGNGSRFWFVWFGFYG